VCRCPCSAADATPIASCTWRSGGGGTRVVVGTGGPWVSWRRATALLCGYSPQHTDSGAVHATTWTYMHGWSRPEPSQTWRRKTQHPHHKCGAMHTKQATHSSNAPMRACCCGTCRGCNAVTPKGPHRCWRYMYQQRASGLWRGAWRHKCPHQVPRRRRRHLHLRASPRKLPTSSRSSPLCARLRGVRHQVPRHGLAQGSRGPRRGVCIGHPGIRRGHRQSRPTARWRHTHCHRWRCRCRWRGEHVWRWVLAGACVGRLRRVGSSHVPAATSRLGACHAW